MAWALWGAAGVAGPAGVIVRVAGTAIGLAIFGCGFWLRRSVVRSHRSAEAPRHDGHSGSMFSAPRYRVVAGLELVALFGGDALLNATGHNGYTIAWYAAVVGIHFVALGRRVLPPLERNALVEARRLVARFR